METITNFINTSNDTKIIKQIGIECKEHLNYLQHMTNSVKEPTIQHVVEQIRKSTNADDMKALITQCNTTIKHIEDERKRVEQEQYSQQILEYLQNHINTGKEGDVETDKLDALLATFKLDYVKYHMTSDYTDYHNVSFSLGGVEIYFKSESGECGREIDMTIGEVSFCEFDVFKCKNINNKDMEKFKQYAKDANITVENYLSFIYKIWDAMTECKFDACFRDICKFIRHDEEHGRGFTPSVSSRSSSISY
jgi:hypothetical protein